MTPSRRQPAFTLVEMVLSMALASIVLLAITSAIVLASQALPDADDETTLAATLDAGSGLARLTGEVRFAMHFSELTATAVTFSVPDRDGDGYPDRIRYHWSGKVGDALYRTYNGGASVAILDAVDALTFSTDTETQKLIYTGAEVKSAETTLSSFFSTSGQNSVRVEYAKWYSQYFKPVLPADALRWQVSRGFFALQYRSPADAIIGFSLHATADDYKPSGAALVSVYGTESSLTSSFLWYEIPFASAPVMNPSDSMAVAFRQYGGNNEACEVLTASPISEPSYCESANTGSSWTYKSGKTIVHYIYGYYWTPGVTRSLARTRYNRFAVTATPTGSREPMRSGCTLDNKPYVAEGFWRLTFDETDPTLVDFNADGKGDWTVRDGVAFDTTDVSGGVWNGDQLLDSKPDSTFAAPTTIALRCKATTSGQVGPMIWINADWGASYSNAGIYAQLVGGSTQTLNLYMEAPGTDTLVKQVTRLPQGTLDLLFVVDPINDEIALFANGVHYGTYSFVFESDSNDTPSVTLQKVDGSAVFEDVTVVVGGTY